MLYYLYFSTILIQNSTINYLNRGESILIQIVKFSVADYYLLKMSLNR